MMRTPAVALVLLMCVTIAGCQRDRRPSSDMSEWEVPEAKRTSVTRTPDAAAPPPSPRPAIADPTLFAGSSGHTPLDSLVGRRCRVQFRRDALGMAVTAPLSPTSEGVGGRPAHIDGTVTAVSESWITLNRDGVSYNIPHAAILLIESRE